MSEYVILKIYYSLVPQEMENPIKHLRALYFWGVLGGVSVLDNNPMEVYTIKNYVYHVKNHKMSYGSHSFLTTF